MFLVDAEHYRLGEPVCALHEVGEMAGDCLSACSKGYNSLEILGRVLVIGNRPSVAVKLVFVGTPAGRIPSADYAMDAIRSEKAIVNALPQAVLIDRATEVIEGIPGLIVERCGSHSQLNPRLKVLQN